VLAGSVAESFIVMAPMRLSLIGIKTPSI
jgi:uncharacterized protein